MKSYRVVGIVVAAVLVSVIGTAHAEMVTNGSFTDGMSSWEVYGGAGPAADSPDGACAYINLNTWLQAKPAAPLVAGQNYAVSFVAKVLGSAGAINDMDKTLFVHVNSDAQPSFARYTPLLTNEWQLYSFQFTPALPETGGSYGLGFLNCAGNIFGGDDAGWAQFGIDNVSMTPVPEPSTLMLALAGLLGLSAYAWRKRK
jgi:hypothetical protein